VRPVRVSDEALADIAIQLRDHGRAEEFARLDLVPALDLLAHADDWHTDTVADGPGRRLTRDGSTVAGRPPSTSHPELAGGDAGAVSVEQPTFHLGVDRPGSG